MNKYFDSFREMISLRGLTDHTLKSYCTYIRTYIRTYLDYLQNIIHKSPEDVSWDEMRDYIQWLHKPWDSTQLPVRKFDTYLPFVPSRQETWDFITSVPDLKQRTMLTLMYSSGLRISEVCSLRYEDIERRNMRIHIRHSKNRSDRYAIPSAMLLAHTSIKMVLIYSPLKLCSDIKLQIITGEKGTGKSALLKMALIELTDTDIVPIWIRLDDLSELYSDILNCNNLYQLKTLWKRSISKLVIINLASHMSFVMGDDFEKTIQWAYETGYSARDFISRSAKILKPMYEKYITLDSESASCGEHHSLQRMIENNKIRLFFDDFDLDWRGTASDVLKIKSLLLSLSDMTSDMEGLSIRIALRTDVYEMIRNEEFSDKYESSIIKCQWNNQEIMKTLAKRICAYYDEPFDEVNTANRKTIQYNIAKYLNFIFVPHFDESTRVWAKAPTHRVIYSLIRRKPRDMVKLCHSIAEEAYRKKLTIIDASCFLVILETYSQERLKDLINEYINQLPKLPDLLIRMAPTQKEFQQKTVERYVYTTAELHAKIKNIQQNMNISIYQASCEKLCVANFHQIAHFLYKIGFITGRKRNESGKIERVYYDESPYLLNSNIGDRGYSWEIHPAYRGALANGTNDNWEATLNIDDDL